MRRFNLPPLNAVRVFESTARHESFTLAGAELGMSQAAVSYQIKLLEDRLGLRLFRRQAGRVTLTDEGRRLALGVSSAFDTLHKTVGDLRDGTEHKLTVAAVVTFAASWLIPRLAAFESVSPGIAVSLNVSQSPIDLTGPDYDVAIVVDDGARFAGVHSDRLFSSRLTPVCSPAFLRDNGIREPRDLRPAHLIGKIDPWWNSWLRAAGVTGMAPQTFTEMIVGSQYLEATAAMCGRGIALLSPPLFATELRSGALVMPFPIFTEEQRSYFLVCPEAKASTRKVKAFRRWLIDEWRAYEGGIRDLLEAA